MNATKRSAMRAGSVACSVLAVVLAGCRTHVVHERTRTVYVPPPAAVVHVPPAPAPETPPPVVHVPPAPAPQPPVVVIESENDFYEPLAAHGRWLVVGSYGRCWIPAHVDVGWRPYSNGYWQWTDAGWYWVSDEPWGWATYHYGRWDFHGVYGWVWVPHTQWSPAWVCWREGGGYVGWAPLRPSVNIHVSIGRVDYEPAFASRAFVFVEHRRMLEPVRPKTVIVNNTTIINKTVNINTVKVVNKTVINEGPRPEVIERESGRKVRAVPVQEFRHREEATVAARERNIPTVSRRKVQAHSRTESQPDSTVTPRNARLVGQPAPVGKPEAIEKPSAVGMPPANPLATPARPTSSRAEAGKPARDEKHSEAETAKNATTPPTFAPKARSGVGPGQTAPTQRDLRPVEKPAVTMKPTTPHAVTTNPVRNKKQREDEIPKKPATTPIAAPTAKDEVKPDRGIPAQRNLRPAGKPAVAAKPAPQPVSMNPIRNGKKAEASIGTITSTSPPAAPKARPEVKPARGVSTQRELRPLQKPALAAKPVPQPATTNAIRDERKHETMSEKRNPSTSPGIGPAPSTEPPSAKQLTSPKVRARGPKQSRRGQE